MRRLTRETDMARLILSTLILLLWAPIAAAGVPFQFGMPGVKAPPGEDVDGMRLVLLHSKNGSVNGFDLGFASFQESRDRSGFSFVLGVSQVTGSSSGCACSIVNLHSGNDSGINAGIVNIVKSISTGVNAAMLNLTEGMSGIDVGALNISAQSNTQIGILNQTGKINNVQIGLLNIAENGFYPVFPFFNYPKS
jgi:hypothetical protein